MQRNDTSKIVHFGILFSFCLKNIILDIFQITEQKNGTENQQLFDGIIDIKLFDLVE